jgi:prevent-host-death family protein
MERTMPATEARIHFGEVLREVAEEGYRIIVERSGEPQVVILSVAEYERLRAGQGTTRWKELVREARARIKDDLGGRELTAPEEIIRRMREERDEQLVDLR